MKNFTLSENRNKDKLFLLNHSEIEKRFDPFYYIPELVELEKQVSKLNPEKLRHYILSIGSGAKQEMENAKNEIEKMILE